ncbi:hypothetical protein [Endozoicomonas ascidiicola]|uniref:hypothetical protein n=1 Tax=Endozoicomonas ascidiicola TaxID=1698521 RepID=UPI00082DAC18|nr:hypothetical protein [Endozoicomonas ascidiicola]
MSVSGVGGNVNLYAGKTSNDSVDEINFDSRGNVKIEQFAEKALRNGEHELHYKNIMERDISSLYERLFVKRLDKHRTEILRRSRDLKMPSKKVETKDNMRRDHQMDLGVLTSKMKLINEQSSKLKPYIKPNFDKEVISDFDDFYCVDQDEEYQNMRKNIDDVIEMYFKMDDYFSKFKASGGGLKISGPRSLVCDGNETVVGLVPGKTKNGKLHIEKLMDNSIIYLMSICLDKNRTQLFDSASDEQKEKVCRVLFSYFLDLLQFLVRLKAVSKELKEDFKYDEELPDTADQFFRFAFDSVSHLREGAWVKNIAPLITGCGDYVLAVMDYHGLEMKDLSDLLVRIIISVTLGHCDDALKCCDLLKGLLLQGAYQDENSKVLAMLPKIVGIMSDHNLVPSEKYKCHLDFNTVLAQLEELFQFLLKKTPLADSEFLSVGSGFCARTVIYRHYFECLERDYYSYQRIAENLISSEELNKEKKRVSGKIPRKVHGKSKRIMEKRRKNMKELKISNTPDKKESYVQIGIYKWYLRNFDKVDIAAVLNHARVELNENKGRLSLHQEAEFRYSVCDIVYHSFMLLLSSCNRFDEARVYAAGRYLNVDYKYDKKKEAEFKEAIVAYTELKVLILKFLEGIITEVSSCLEFFKNASLSSEEQKGMSREVFKHDVSIRSKLRVFLKQAADLAYLYKLRGDEYVNKVMKPGSNKEYNRWVKHCCHLLGSDVGYIERLVDERLRDHDSKSEGNVIVTPNYSNSVSTDRGFGKILSFSVDAMKMPCLLSIGDVIKDRINKYFFVDLLRIIQSDDDCVFVGSFSSFLLGESAGFNDIDVRCSLNSHQKITALLKGILGFYGYKMDEYERKAIYCLNMPLVKVCKFTSENDMSKFFEVDFNIMDFENDFLKGSVRVSIKDDVNDEVISFQCSSIFNSSAQMKYSLSLLLDYLRSSEDEILSLDISRTIIFNRRADTNGKVYQLMMRALMSYDKGITYASRLLNSKSSYKIDDLNKEISDDIFGLCEQLHQHLLRSTYFAGFVDEIDRWITSYHPPYGLKEYVEKLRTLLIPNKQ